MRAPRTAIIRARKRTDERERKAAAADAEQAAFRAINRRRALDERYAPKPEVSHEDQMNAVLLRIKLGKNSFVDLYEVHQQWKKGRIAIADAVTFTEICSRYPNRPVAYTVLEMARMGKLTYKMSDQEKLDELEKMC